MSQVAEKSVGPTTMDPYEIGWYIESADEEIYGPVSRKALRRFLEEKTITPNTLVRHCTQPEARPAADQPVIMEQLSLDTKGSAVGDKLAEAWPRKKRDRLALAEGLGAVCLAQAARHAGVRPMPCPLLRQVPGQALPQAVFPVPPLPGRHVQSSSRRAGSWTTSSSAIIPIIVATLSLMAWLGDARQSRLIIVYLVQLSVSSASFSCATRSSAAPGRQASGRLAGRADKRWEDAAHQRPGRRALAEPVHPILQSGRCCRSRTAIPCFAATATAGPARE